MKIALAIIAVALSGCAVTTPDGDVTITVPAIDIDVRPEHRDHIHLTREWVDRGVRYCQYNNGEVTRQYWRSECPRVWFEHY
jgi:hypothetical protein